MKIDKRHLVAIEIKGRPMPIMGTHWFVRAYLSSGSVIESSGYEKKEDAQKAYDELAEGWPCK